MNTLLLEHLAAVSKIAAYRQAREHQEGVDASQGYLTTTAAGVLFEGPRTFVCHFKYEAGSRLQVIAGFTVPMMALEIAPSTNLLSFYCGTTSATAPIVPGNNYQAVISYDGTAAVCYLNGSEAARFTVAGYAVTNVFSIGNPSYPPVGPVYSSSHFNYTLSAGEVSALWNNGDPAGYVVPLADKYRWEASESNIGNIRFYPNDEGSGVTSYLKDNANGFTGRYAHIIWGSSGLLSVYSYQFMGHPVGCVVEAKFKYRSNAPVRVLADNSSLPINMEDAADVTIVYRTTGTIISGFSVTVPNADANSWVEIQPVSLRMLGCVAEYLPQNLVGSPHGDPVEIIGENSHTWTGVDDPAYSHAVRCSRYFKISEVYKMRVTISDYEAGGAPFFKISTADTVILSGFNGDGTYELYLQVKGTPYQFVYVYAGPTGSDRRVTITVDSIEPVPGVATSWLDSARQIPLNDEYLPPLLQSDGGYDLTASGTSEIIIK
jgi:hypothetical protein